MTLVRLKEIMLYQLRGFVPKKQKDSVTVGTRLSSILSSENGPPPSSELYQDFVCFSVLHFGGELKDWPTDWLGQTISELAPKILVEESE